MTVRFHTDNGEQIVQVALGRDLSIYTYAWGGDPPLRLREEVMLPLPPWAEPDPTGWVRGTVYDLGSEYNGPLKLILGRAPARTPPAPIEPTPPPPVSRLEAWLAERRRESDQHDR